MKKSVFLCTDEETCSYFMNVEEKNKKEELGDENSALDIFKQCPACGESWKTREDMLADHEVYIIGYQAHFEDLKLGLFLFNHSCKGTFSIPAGEFINMYSGPIFHENLTGSEECPGHCRHKKNLEPCPAKCECAYIREVVQLLKKEPVSSHRVPKIREGLK